MYRYRFDHARNLLDIHWTGMFTPEQIADYATAIRRDFDLSGFRPGYLLRIDMSGSAVQSQDGARAFRTAFRDFPQASRIAIVTQSAIARLQIRREMTQPYLRVAATPEAAIDWLLHGREP